MTETVRTYLIPFPRDAVIVIINTRRELTDEEEEIVCEAYKKHSTPFKKINNLHLILILWSVIRQIAIW